MTQTLHALCDQCLERVTVEVGEHRYTCQCKACGWEDTGPAHCAYGSPQPMTDALAEDYRTAVRLARKAMGQSQFDSRCPQCGTDGQVHRSGRVFQVDCSACGLVAAGSGPQQRKEMH